MRFLPLGLIWRGTGGFDINGNDGGAGCLTFAESLSFCWSLSEMSDRAESGIELMKSGLIVQIWFRNRDDALWMLSTLLSFMASVIVSEKMGYRRFVGLNRWMACVAKSNISTFARVGWSGKSGKTARSKSSDRVVSTYKSIRLTTKIRTALLSSLSGVIIMVRNSSRTSIALWPT